MINRQMILSMMNKRLILLLLAVGLMAASCGTPKNIVYLQDVEDQDLLRPAQPDPIRLQPMDQISVIVNTLDPQLSAMFNLPYFTRRLGETQSLSGSGASNMNTSSSQIISGYTVDGNGEIDFPVIGKIHVGGLTRQETTELIKQKIIDSKQVKDPTVTVEFMNLGFSVLGEVTRPGRFRIDRDQFTLFDAISLAGDLTINGERGTILVMRHTPDGDACHRIDLTSAEQIYASPAFYIQQGDVVYVTPNEKRRRESTINGNNVRSGSFWISLASLATSMASTIAIILSR